MPTFLILVHVPTFLTFVINKIEEIWKIEMDENVCKMVLHVNKQNPEEFFLVVYNDKSHLKDGKIFLVAMQCPIKLDLFMSFEGTEYSCDKSKQWQKSPLSINVPVNGMAQLDKDAKLSYEKYLNEINTEIPWKNQCFN